MKAFNIDAFRRAMEPAQSSAAQDLVQRTLAQHGLGQAGGPAQAGRFAMPAMAGLPLQQAGRAATSKVLPEGASFDAARFTCDAGGREYLTYVPASAADGARGLVMMLHGCTQTHTDFATGTDMNRLAEEHRLIVVYPLQSRGDNAQSCWNWFSRGDQRRGRGEPAILAGLAAKIAATHVIPASKTYVAGLSAGAAMAVILAQTYGDVFAAVGVHSGLPYGAAHDVPSAFAAMAGRAEAGAIQPGAVFVPTILFHGTADHTVQPSNADRIAKDAMATAPDLTMSATDTGTAKGRAFTKEIVTDGSGKPLLENWTVEGLGHAWSGGNSAGSYTDAAGPDASAEMARFFLSLA